MWLRGDVELIGKAPPRFSTVSIMPGMDTAAPERTDTSRGIRPDGEELFEIQSGKFRVYDSMIF